MMWQIIGGIVLLLIGYAYGRRGREQQMSFAVAQILKDGPMEGRDLRKMLRSVGFRPRLPSFYVFMSRLEDREIVQGEETTKSVDGYTVHPRRYSLKEGVVG